MKIDELKLSIGLINKYCLKFAFLNLMIFVLILIFTSEAIAQSGMKGKKSSGLEKSYQYDRMYDTKTVETIVGEVITMEKPIPIKGKYARVHLMIKSNKEYISIHLGPQWFIDNQSIKILSKDNVEIKGS